MEKLIITYGLTSQQNMILNCEFPNNEIRDVTECFTDLIAVPAIAIVINPYKLSEYETSVFNELFKYDYDTCIIFTNKPIGINQVLYVREEDHIGLTDTVKAIKETLDLPRQYACAVKRLSNVITDIRNVLNGDDDLPMSSKIVNIDSGCFVYEVITLLLKHKKTLKLRERYPYRVELNSILMSMMLAHGYIRIEDLDESEDISFYDNEWIASLSENIRNHYRKTVNLNY